MADTSEDVMWSVETEGGGDVCLRIGIGVSTFEIWLDPEQAIEIGAGLRNAGTEAKGQDD
jgi:hypothetical protein